MQRWKTLAAMLIVGSVMVAALRAQAGQQEASGKAMTEAATAF